MGGKYSELSFFSHRIHVRIEGFRLEQLLDRALNEGLDIRSFRLISDTEAVCQLSAADLKKLRRLAKSSYRITAAEERGVLIELTRFLRRPALILGCLLALVMVIGQSFFIQTVEVNGYRGIPETELLRCLEKQGIYKWAWRPGIDWDAAEQNIYHTFPEITWVQLVYDGRLVVLNISETSHDIYYSDVQDYGPAEKRTTYINLVAEEAGYIETIVPWYGAAQVEAGDYVEKGQILISGCVPLEPTTFGEEEEKKKEYFVNAKGEVWAMVPYRLKFHQERYLWGEPSDAEEPSDLGELSDAEEPSDNEAPADTGEPDDGGENLVVNRVEKTEEQAKRKTEQQIRLWAKENLPETAEIQKKSLKFSRDGNIIIVSVLLEVRQQIASPQEELIGTKTRDTREH